MGFRCLRILFMHAMEKAMRSNPDTLGSGTDCVPEIEKLGANGVREPLAHVAPTNVATPDGAVPFPLSPSQITELLFTVSATNQYVEFDCKTRDEGAVNVYSSALVSF